MLLDLQMPQSDLDLDIAAFDKMRDALESRYMAKWVVIHQARLSGIYESFDEAANEAVDKFGRGPFLIRQIGALPVTLPASVMYHPEHASSKVRV